MKARPKTGEKRKTRQPLKIDRLPVEVHDEIVRLHLQDGRPFEEIEELSKKFVVWDKLPRQVLELFPDLRIPKTNLHRWFDLRVSQVMERNEEERRFAQEIAADFKQSGFEDLDESVVNAIAKEVFVMARSAKEGDKQAFRKDLLNLGFLLAEVKKNTIRERKVKVDEERLGQIERELQMKQQRFDQVTNEAAKKLGKGKPVTLADINVIRERAFGLPPIASAGHPA
jgi:hypothetical protein